MTTIEASQPRTARCCTLTSRWPAEQYWPARGARGQSLMILLSVRGGKRCHCCPVVDTTATVGPIEDDLPGLAMTFAPAWSP